MTTTSSMMNLMTMMASALLAMAFYTLGERKLLGYMQSRKGPNKPSIMAIMVPMADAGKLFTKQEKMSTTMNKSYFNIAPMVMIILSLMLWPIFPMNYSSFFMKFNILYFLCITSMNIYTTFITGWSSNSKWGLLGALRGIAQTISYEVSMSIILICFILHPAMMNTLMIMRDEYCWTMMMLVPMSMSWMISILAETHRTPFDFSEGESELVSGFNIEYKSSMFALIFMAEYMNILLMSLITMSIMTKSHSNTELLLKTTLMSLIFIWARGSLPRMRYDILMNSLWKKILPMSLMCLMATMHLVATMKWYCAGSTDNLDEINYDIVQYL